MSPLWLAVIDQIETYLTDGDVVLFAFVGDVPSELGELSSLSKSKKATGSSPDVYTDSLIFLPPAESLELHYNNLEGDMPEEGRFHSSIRLIRWIEP